MSTAFSARIVKSRGENIKNFTIKTPKGPDRVRLRPVVIFGSEGTDGIICMTRMLLDAFVTEAALTVPGTKCRIPDEQSGKSDVFFYPNGLINYVGGQPFIKEIEATGQDRYNKRSALPPSKIRSIYSHRSSLRGAAHSGASIPKA
ncbi:MAG: hypothetical protein IKY33_01255 [Clostridia bacterium]|nr:hypothetical protein [Clostridia bacterium]